MRSGKMWTNFATLKTDAAPREKSAWIIVQSDSPTYRCTEGFFLYFLKDPKPVHDRENHVIILCQMLQKAKMWRILRTGIICDKMCHIVPFFENVEHETKTIFAFLAVKKHPEWCASCKNNGTTYRNQLLRLRKVGKLVRNWGSYWARFSREAKTLMAVTTSNWL